MANPHERKVELVDTLPHPLHLFVELTGGAHYHFGWFEDPERDPVVEAQHRMSERCAELLPDGGRVLDVGAGLGGSARHFAARGHETVGLDPCPASMEYARRLEAGAAAPEFRTATFDEFCALEKERRFSAVVFLESLQHIGSTEAALRQCRRLLIEGGVVVVCDTFQFANLPREQVPFHHLDGFLQRLRGAGVETLRHESLAHHAVTTLTRFLQLLEEERLRLWRRFRETRPDIEAETDEIRRHGEALLEAFQNGDLTLEMLAFRLT